MFANRSSRGRRAPILVAISLCITAALSACGSEKSSSSEGETTIGFVSPGADVPIWIDSTSGAKDADKKLQDATVIVGTGKSSADRASMIPVIENMITRQVDVLVVPGFVELIPALEKARAKDIPVVFYAGVIPDSDIPTSVINTDNTKGGFMIGEYMAKTLDIKGDVAVIRYPAGLHAHVDQRVDGFLAGIKGSDIKVTYLDVGCDAVQPAVTAMQNVLTRIPDLAGVFGQCGAPALGAAAAIKKSGTSKSIPIVGFDLEPAQIDGIKNGTQAAGLAQYTHKMGVLSVETALKVAQGETVPEFIDSGSMLVTPENVDDIADMTF